MANTSSAARDSFFCCSVSRLIRNDRSPAVRKAQPLADLDQIDAALGVDLLQVQHGCRDVAAFRQPFGKRRLTDRRGACKNDRFRHARGLRQQQPLGRVFKIAAIVIHGVLDLDGLQGRARPVHYVTLAGCLLLGLPRRNIGENGSSCRSSTTPSRASSRLTAKLLASAVARWPGGTR